MPATHSISLYTSARTRPVALDGYTWSEHHDAFIPEDEACGTRHDGIVHDAEVCSCDRCGENLGHDINRDEYTTAILDVGGRWCDDCRDEYASYVGQGNCEEGYYQDPPPEDGIADYHSLDRRKDGATYDNPFRIGFEIEKEDEEMRERLADGYELPKGWIVESDGSLDDDTGFEVVTRAYNLLHLETIRTDMQAAAPVLDAKFSKACGGHISISDYRYTPLELAERIRPLFPLLLALYPKRLTGTYSKPMKGKDHGNGGRNGDKYVAFSIDKHEGPGARIELRLPSAVRDTRTLLWRLDLISHFLLASKDKPLTWAWMRHQMGKKGEVRALLHRAYDNPADPKTGRNKVLSVIRLYMAFAGWYYRDLPANEAIAEFIAQYPKDPPRTMARIGNHQPPFTTRSNGSVYDNNGDLVACEDPNCQGCADGREAVRLYNAQIAPAPVAPVPPAVTTVPLAFRAIAPVHTMADIARSYAAITAIPSDETLATPPPTEEAMPVAPQEWTVVEDDNWSPFDEE